MIPARTGTHHAHRTAAGATLDLADARALDASVAGAKAANLARAAVRGLPALPGFVLTTGATPDGKLDDGARAALRAAWERLTAGRPVPLVVRSSSTVEDTSTSSMAGQFTSILDVAGWDAFLEATQRVLASATRPRSGNVGTQPMAVLVQRQLDARCGGVLFGLDPVTGDRRHLVVEAVLGGPDGLVSGTVAAAHLTLTRRGRLLDGPASPVPCPLAARHRRRLARLARRAERVFGGPQDIEWAIDPDDRLWLLQARAVTATGAATVAGPVLGPGPVAETFPDALRPLEADLWVPPLRDGVAGTLRVLGIVGHRRVERSPVVTTVGGRVAADLDLFGRQPAGRGVLRLLNPAPAARRLVAAWRVGRLRAALPAIAAGLVARVDAELAAIPHPSTLDERTLLDVLERSRGVLTSLHGHEVMAGMLSIDGDDDRPSLAALALAAQAAAPELRPGHAVARSPVILALVPPAIGPPPTLPGTPAAGAAHGSPPPVSALGHREALRLRCRWVQELTARVAQELGARLAADGTLAGAGDVRELTLAELRTAVTTGAAPHDLADRRSVLDGPPLPPAFRLDAQAQPRAVDTAAAPRAGLAASAGRATGVACHDPGTASVTDHPVLVVDTLDPRLAAVLPALAAVISETGSALSHLAILAREAHVPAVVAVPDARRRFPPGSTVLVDGSTGEVALVEEGGAR